MKIQCSCGIKYEFDVTPEMARAPIKFICQKCGVDSSEMVNRLVRQQLGLPEPSAPPVPSLSPQGVRGESAPSSSIPPTVPSTAPPPTTDVVVARVNSRAASSQPAPSIGQAPQSSSGTPLAPSRGGLRVSVHKPAVASEANAPAVEAPQVCLKHPDQLTAHRCLVCQKPMCPKCMELFGFVCSALCRGKAQSQGKTLPVYEHQKNAIDARQWQKAVRIGGGVIAAIVVLLGVWFWYAWFASVPHPVFSVRFEQASYSGQCQLLPKDQVVFLHGGTLARHDMKAKKEIWSAVLIDKKAIAVAAAEYIDRENKELADAVAKKRDVSGWPRPPPLAEYITEMEREAAAPLQLHVQDENVWVSFRDKLVRYDWDTGKASKEIPLTARYSHFIPNGDELLLISQRQTGQKVTHLNLVSGESHTEEIAAPASALTAAGEPQPGSAGNKKSSVPSNRASTNQLAAASRRNAPSGKTGLNQPALAARLNTNQLAALRAAGAAGGRPGQARTKPLDPAAVAAQVQNMPYASKLALPAVLAANANQQRALDEMEDEPEFRSFVPDREGFERTTLLPDGAQFVQFTVKMLEYKSVARQMMKAAPTKSALDGDVNASSTTAVANEIFNEIQRDRGGDVEMEDVSRYQVTLRRPGAAEAGEWVGEVIGPSEVFTLKTVNVLAAGTAMSVFDKTNKKLWESKLSFPIGAVGRALLSGEARHFGEGPIVERGDTLYLFDQGVLTAFELGNGNARWRLPAVGISGLHFDDKGMIYVNTSSASPDILRYPNQIDISEKATQVILKINAKTGATVWRLDQEGLVSYVSGKYVYTTFTHAGDDSVGSLLGMKTAFDLPPHIRIKRLDPGNGRVMWDHYQERFPLDFHFDKNTIQLLFKKEMLVLKYFTL